MLVTFVYDPAVHGRDPSGLLCIPLLCTLLLFASGASAGAALPNKTVPVSELFTLMESSGLSSVSVAPLATYG